MKRNFVMVGLLLLLAFPASAIGEEAPLIQTIGLIDIPTAWVLPERKYSLNFRLFTGGGFLFKGTAGIKERFMAGLSYGGSEVIGTGEADENPHIGLALKYKIINETEKTSAVAVGFDSQGYGNYKRVDDCYQVRSKGFYVAASKNIEALRGMQVHGGVNLTLEDSPDYDQDLLLFGGLAVVFNPHLRLMFEYNNILEDSNGYFNAGIRWDCTPELSLEFVFKDLAHGSDSMNRMIRIGYSNYF